MCSLPESRSIAFRTTSRLQITSKKRSIAAKARIQPAGSYKFVVYRTNAYPVTAPTPRLSYKIPNSTIIALSSDYGTLSTHHSVDGVPGSTQASPNRIADVTIDTRYQSPRSFNWELNGG